MTSFLLEISRSLSGLLALTFGFALLVATFLAISRLRTVKRQTKGSDVPRQSSSSRRLIHGPNLALVFGIISVLTFPFSSFALIVSLAGIYYGVWTLWQGVVRLGIVVLRALVGLMLATGSVGLHFLRASGQLPTWVG